jgi:hypothetical protein
MKQKVFINDPLNLKIRGIEIHTYDNPLQKNTVCIDIFLVAKDRQMSTHMVIDGNWLENKGKE